jgi:hypothetical protein
VNPYDDDDDDDDDDGDDDDDDDDDEEEDGGGGKKQFYVGSVRFWDSHTQSEEEYVCGANTGSIWFRTRDYIYLACRRESFCRFFLQHVSCVFMQRWRIPNVDKCFDSIEMETALVLKSM